MNSKLNLNRMMIEEAGPNPERLAEAILSQLDRSIIKIPVEEIAYSLDIFEIRYEKLESHEGALLMTPERDIGSILVNANSARPRRRFTIAHELGHYLNIWHKPHDEVGFMCNKKDFRVGNFVVKPALTAREVQELQANSFAIELLAPKNRVIALSNDDPSVSDVLRIATELDLSKEAAARRYVDLHPASIAVVFTLNGKVKYPVTSPSCRRFIMPKGTSLLPLASYQPGEISNKEIEVDLSAISGQVSSITAEAETFYQEGGHAFTILNFEPELEEGSDSGVDSTFEPFSRF